MDNRFTLKDFIFTVLLILVIAIVIFTGWKFSYQESRINDVRSQIQRLDETQKQELTTLQEIRNALRSGVSVTGNATGPARSERIRQKNPDGSQYIYFPDIPTSPRDPSRLPDYATGDWLVATRLAAASELILAGGLNAHNVAEAIGTVRPFGVDVSSGVELTPGHKSPQKIAEFVQAARAAFAGMQHEFNRNR